MSSLFSHCIRHELYSKLNPIASVRQSAVRQRDPDILTLGEIRLILGNIEPQAIKIMVATAAASALRRSEFRGLKWAGPRCRQLLVPLSARPSGKVRNQNEDAGLSQKRGDEPYTGCGTPGRGQLTPYPQDTDWVFASPFHLVDSPTGRIQH